MKYTYITELWITIYQSYDIIVTQQLISTSYFVSSTEVCIAFLHTYSSVFSTNTSTFNKTTVPFQTSDLVKYDIVLGYTSITLLSEIIVTTGLNSAYMRVTEYVFEWCTYI